MLERIKRFLSIKQSESYRAIVSLFRSGQPVWTPVNYAALSKEGFSRNVYVFACVEKTAKACAGINWLLYRKGRNGDVIEIYEHPLLDLMERPNPWQGQASFIENVIAYLRLSGNSYIEKVGPKNGPPRELYTLRPDRMKVIPGNAQEPVAGYIYEVAGNKVTFGTDEILHLKTFNPLNDWYGLSPLEIAARSIDQNNASRAWNVGLLQNGARPSGALVYPETLQEDQYERLREQIEQKYAGPKNAGRPLILEGGLDWKEMGLSPRDMNWIEGLRLSAREISIALGVPSELIGDSTNKTYSNYQEARKAFYQETVLPLMDWLRDDLNNWLTPMFGERLYLDYDRDDIEALQEERSAVWTRSISAVNSGILTPNEARETMGYEAIEGGDSLRVPASMIPLSAFDFEDEDDEGKGLQVRSFNLEGDNQRKLYWKSFERQRAGWYVAVQKQVAKQFRAERKLIKQELQSASSADSAVMRADMAIKEHAESWEKLLKATYLAVGEDFAQRVFSSIKSAYPTEVKAQGIDIWQNVVLDWLRKQGAKKVRAITETTRKQLRAELAAGVREGESIQELAKRVDKLYLEQIIPNRSVVIARTEVISASNLGSRAGAKETGLPLLHEWIATPDERTREAHAEADGQTVPLDEPFEVDGEQLMFPGDDSLGASAENLIQCRCTEAYQVVPGLGGGE